MGKYAALQPVDGCVVFPANSSPDTAESQPGLSAFDLDTLRSVFDSVLYPTDTAAFGRESDIDGNGVVIVLLTNTVNKMVGNPCATYVAGFFFGGDIDPLYRRLFN